MPLPSINVADALLDERRESGERATTRQPRTCRVWLKDVSKAVPAAPVTAIASGDPGACLPRVLPAERQESSMNTESFNRTLKAIALAAMLIATMLLATGCLALDNVIL